MCTLHLSGTAGDVTSASFFAIAKMVLPLLCNCNFRITHKQVFFFRGPEPNLLSLLRSGVPCIADTVLATLQSIARALTSVNWF